ncbi:MAG: hypothetical protein JWM10_5071 [Myxococcaceae bacterium]|nr:hypothetical protein [Myxococcaceae bacterium]
MFRRANRFRHRATVAAPRSRPTDVPGHVPAYRYLHDEDRLTPGPHRFASLMETLWEALPQPSTA